MKEDVLHYIWKTQSFTTHTLQTTQGSAVRVFSPGSHNEDAGPDFLGAQIKIDSVTWAGHVEIHINSSEWIKHHHQKDKKYEGVILHVVWKDDRPVQHRNGEYIHTLELKDFVDADLLERYHHLVSQAFEIPCFNLINSVDPIHSSMMIERSVIDRLENKATEVLDIFQLTNKDWEETAYRLLARSFGLKVNKHPFYDLAADLPFSLLKRNQSSELTQMALVFGRAGFLEEESADPYFKNLKKEYIFQKQKYGFTQKLQRHHWKYSKLRPYSFPTVRLARFSMFMSQATNLFDTILSVDDTAEFRKTINQATHFYWSDHYDFDKKSSRDYTIVGGDFASILIINGLIPIWVAYSKATGQQEWMNKALAWLELQKPERNKITKKYQQKGFPLRSAMHSQGILQLYHAFCREKRCLSCNIGVQILK